MLTPERLDRIHVAFDDQRLVANAGLIRPVILARQLGLGELADRRVDQRRAIGAGPVDRAEYRSRRQVGPFPGRRQVLQRFRFGLRSQPGVVVVSVQDEQRPW